MSKISELSDGGSLVSSDYLIAVRSGGNVKVRMDQINVDQVDLGDNEFIRLGNSQDLTMVHNASNSIINQAGIGDLLLQKAGVTKLTINASGIDVTGTVTADGLVVSNPDGSIVKLESTGTGLGAGAVLGDLQFYGNDASVPGAGIKASITATTVSAVGDDSQLMFSTSDGTANNVNRMLISNNGDLSLYENTGTTPKLFWDASDESLILGSGVNTYAKLTIAEEGTSAGSTIRLVGTNTIGGASQVSHITSYQPAGGAASDAALDFKVRGGADTFGSPSTVMTLLGGGSVGIGTSSPLNSLHIQDSALNKMLITNDDYVNGTTGTSFDVSFGSTSGNTYSEIRHLINGRSAWGNFVLARGGGSVGIGTTSPASVLDVRGARSDLLRLYSTAAGGNAEIELLTLNNASSVGKLSKITATQVGADTNGSILAFSTSPTTGNTPEEAMRIDASGRVLINKTLPTGSLSLEAQAPAGFSVGSGFYADGSQSTIEFKDGNTTANYKVRIGSETDDLLMFAGGSERLRIDASGHAIIPAGVTLGTAVGVYNAANTLDDYEEGTWTPDFLNVTSTVTSATGSYTKIGRVVFFSVNINLSALDNTDLSGVTISLPLASSGNEALMTMDTSATTLIGNADKSLVLGAYTAGSAMILTKSTGALLYTDAQASGVFVVSGQFRTA